MKIMSKCFGTVATTAACAIVLFSAEAKLQGAERQLIPGHVPKGAAGLHPLRHMEGTNVLSLAIGLPLRDKPGLTNLLQQIYDPASTNYHHYLTAAQFTQRFGPTVTDYEAVGSFAMAHHLKIVGSHPNRMLLDVQGTVADVEAALNVTMQVYQYPTKNREFFAPDREPSIDLNVAVLHIGGLDNFDRPKSLMHKLPKPQSAAQPLLPGAGTNAPLGGSGPFGYYLGTDFRNAYVPGVGLNGSQQNVALVEFDGYYASDITAYEQLAGLPNVNLVNVAIDGGIVGGPGGGVGEVSLDIEMVVAMAPGVSTIYVYEAPNPSPIDDVINRIATDDSSRQISASWTYDTDATTEQIYQEFAMQGQSFYQASGDSDAYVGVIESSEDDPNITLVGGTELVMNGSGVSYASESVWNIGYQPPGGAPQFSNYWGSGGGISTVRPIPSWQQGINMTTNQGSTNFRNLPDVALTADNIWIIAGLGTQTGPVGGTSCAAPLWAAFTALVNQQAAAGGDAPMGFINPAVYAIGKGSNYTSCFHDTTAGNNIWPGSGGLFSAVPGYDLCTGWGTPTGTSLINALAPLPSNIPILIVGTNYITGGNGNGVVDPDECNNLTIVISNVGVASATGVEVSLSSSTTGAIVAQGISAYPTISPHTGAANLTPFTLSTEPSFVCGTPVQLALVLKSDQGIQTNTITLPSGAIGPPVSFASSTPVVIPDTGTPVPVSSPVVVSNLQAAGKVTVSVFLASQYDLGLTLSLIAPNGTNVILSQNDGGFASDFGASCSQPLTFDDDATNSIITSGGPFVGNFQPQQPLSTFNLYSGANLNGVWSLQVSDALQNDPAELVCWSLNISPETCIDGGGQCPGADLSLKMSVSPTVVYEGSNLVYTLTVSNAGPSAANNVGISQNLPLGSIFNGTTGYPVSSTVSANTNVTLLLGTLPVYGSATVNVLATAPMIPGVATSSAEVGSSQTDPNEANNSASASVLVSAPAADMAVTMIGSPTSVLEGGLLTYTILVTNNGPFPANGVLLSTTLPTNSVLISNSAGTLSGNVLNASLGTMADGASKVVTVVVSPTLTGNITATTVVSISPTETDPITFNNTASVTTTVAPAADLGVSGFATPTAVVAGNNYTNFLTFYNSGPSTATGVTFTETMPAGATLSSNSLTNFTTNYTLTSNLLTAVLSTNMTGGASINVTNVFTSAALKAGAKSNLMVSTISIFGSPGDPNTNNNALTLSVVAAPPTITIVPAGTQIISGSTDGAIGTNGTYKVSFTLQNAGNIPTANLTATLASSNGITVTNPPETLAYGNLSPGQSATMPFTFNVHGSNGGSIQATLILTNSSTNLGVVTFTFAMPIIQTFTNTSYISIPTQANIPYPESGPANPYPSTITVSGVSGDVAAVTVTVSNLYHTFPNDIGMLLIGPSGASCVLMSAAVNETTMTKGATLTFDQNSTNVMAPDNSLGSLVSGTYQPCDYYDYWNDGVETFTNSPVPVGPYMTNLSVFAGPLVNGTWSLYVEDDSMGNAGAISNGWSLSFTTITPVDQVADLAVSVSDVTNSVFPGDNITYIWAVTNNGPNTATNVSIVNTLPTGLTLISNGVPPGAGNIVNVNTSTVTVSNLTSGSFVMVTNVASTANLITLGSITSLPCTITNTVSVTSSVLDANLLNNTNSLVTTIKALPADLTAAPISAAPNPVVINSNLTYTLWVTNNGPSNALDVLGIFTNSVNLTLTAHSVSQGNLAGSYATPTNFVEVNFGTIHPGNAAEAVLTFTVSATNTMTSGWAVSNAYGNDTNLADNSVTASVVVTPKLPIIIAGAATFNGSIVSGQPVTVNLGLVNVGAAPTTNLVATLVGVSNIITNSFQSRTYGALAIGGSATNSFTFEPVGGSGATLVAMLVLKDGTNSLPSVTENFMIPVTITINNGGIITIPYEGEGSPYPSIVQISEAQSNLAITKVTATLNGFTHSWPSDVEVELVSPTGQQLMLMEHTGAYYGVSGLTLMFDDAGPNGHLPQFAPLTNGTFYATEYTNFDVLPGLSAIPAGSTNLATFNGENPNGIWSLYVYDDSPGNDGYIANGWSLNITATVSSETRPVLAFANTPGQLQLTITGTTGDVYNLQSSTNLTTWTTVGVGVAPFTTNIAIPTNVKQMFYRAVTAQ